MSSEKSWYTGIVGARTEGSDSKAIADWFKEGDTPLNPYTYRKVPKSVLAFYLYTIQVLYSITTDPYTIKRIDTGLKNILAQDVTDKQKIYYSVMTLSKEYNEVCLNLETTDKKCTVKNIPFKLSSYLGFLPNVSTQLGNVVTYFNTIGLDDILTDFATSLDDSSENELLSEEMYELFLENISTIKDNKSDKNEVIILRETYVCNLLLFLISLEKEYYSVILTNLTAYADMFPTNSAGERIVSRPFLEGFKTLIENEADKTKKKNLLQLFLQKLLEFKSNRSITNETLLYDAFNLVTVSEEGEGNNYTPLNTTFFRRDFDRSIGLAAEFTKKELEAINQCYFQQKSNFSSFINILNTNTTKQGAIDSLFISMPACSSILATVGISSTKEKPLELKNESQEQQETLEQEFLKAVQEGNKKRVSELLAQHVNINVKTKDETQATALQLAILYNKTEIAMFLIRNYANIDEQDAKGNTALMYAAFRGNIVVVQALLLQPANTQIQNDNGQKIDIVVGLLDTATPNLAEIKALLQNINKPGGLEAAQRAIESQASATSGQPIEGGPHGPGTVTNGQVTVQNPLATSREETSYVIVASYPKDMALEERKVLALEQMARIKTLKLLLQLSTK